MGTIVLHAGMGKAGSSSIQAWLADQAGPLREHGVEAVVARHRHAHGRVVGVNVLPYRSGKVQANGVITAHWSEGVDKRTVFGDLFDGLDAAAARHRAVVLSGEALQRVFWQSDETFLRGLESLAGRHRVRVAYYVRPQHTALEAHWRQWGFRTGRPPSEDLGTRADVLRYFDTYAAARALAPSVSFEPRPFRGDLLHLGDPAADFAHEFIGVPELVPDGPTHRVNEGLPLEIVNALRHAPAGLLWSSTGDNDRLGRIKQVLSELDAPETESTRSSRLVLQAFCHERFEAGNRRLIDALSWNTTHFVPPVGPSFPAGDGRLEALDELWQTHASEAVLQALYLALDHASTPSKEDRRLDHSAAGSRLRQLRERLARTVERRRPSKPPQPGG